MIKKRILPIIALCLALPFVNEAKPYYDAAALKSHVILSPVYTVDKIYRSMYGPYSTQEITLVETKQPELIWVTGYKAVMKGADGKTPQLQEFMCHSNLDFDGEKHKKIFGWNQHVTDRLFTLSQGQFEIDFPEGFGMPMMSNETLQLTTQVLNLNPIEGIEDVRHKVTIKYVRNKDLKRPMKPLIMVGANGLKLIEGKDGYYRIDKPDPKKHGPGCLMGEQAGARTWDGMDGRKFTGHWVVKPGVEVNHTNVTQYMNLKYDTTIHYIAVHLHPFAEHIYLKDLTTGEIVFASDVEGYDDKIGIKHVQYYSSKEGIPVYKDHEYELVSTYNNTSGQDQDSMAVFYMYLLDKQFKGPMETILLNTSS